MSGKHLPPHPCFRSSAGSLAVSVKHSILAPPLNHVAGPLQGFYTSVRARHTACWTCCSPPIITLWVQSIVRRPPPGGGCNSRRPLPTLMLCHARAAHLNLESQLAGNLPLQSTSAKSQPDRAFCEPVPDRPGIKHAQLRPRVSPPSGQRDGQQSTSFIFHANASLLKQG